MIEPIAPGLPELPPDPIPPSPAQRPAGQVDLEAAKATLRRLRAALIATSDRLDVPYTDGPEWTPWSRYINPAMSALDETFDALLADLDAARDALRRAQPVLDTARAFVHGKWTVEADGKFRDFLAAVRTYESQEG